MTIREEIKKLLAQSGLTQYKFCKDNGIYRTNFAAYLRGKDTLSAKKLDYILDALRRATPSTTLGDCSDILSPEILEAAGWTKRHENEAVENFEKEVDDVWFNLDFRKRIKKIDIQVEGLIKARLDIITVEEFNKLLDIIGLQRFTIIQMNKQQNYLPISNIAEKKIFINKNKADNTLHIEYSKPYLSATIADISEGKAFILLNLDVKVKDNPENKLRELSDFIQKQFPTAQWQLLNYPDQPSKQ